jgi:hypothetical protein
MAATLRSNDGEAEFAVAFDTPTEYAHDPGFEASVHVRGQHWDGDHTHPLSASVEGLWLRLADVVALRDHIADWGAQPLDRLVPESLNREFRLARLPEQCVHIRFGPRPDTASHLHPVISITVSAGAFHCEFHFATDQSCLALFAQELSSECIGSHENAV